MHLWDEFENTLISFWSYRVRKIFRKFELWPQPEIWTCPRPTTVKFNPGISLALVSCFSALNSVNSTGVQVGSIWIYSLWSRSVYRKKKTPPVGQKCFVRVHRHVLTDLHLHRVKSQQQVVGVICRMRISTWKSEAKKRFPVFAKKWLLVFKQLEMNCWAIMCNTYCQPSLMNNIRQFYEVEAAISLWQNCHWH